MQRIKFQDAQGIRWGNLHGETIEVLQSMQGKATGEEQKLEAVRLLAPCEASIIICVGKNYAKHVREMGGDALPQEPGLFLKALNTLADPEEGIPYPSWTENLHYEGELAIVISKTMHRVSEAEALDYVLGYTCACDVTARDKQRSDLQWARAKSADKFCPLGPWLETELDPSALQVQTRVNGELRQDGSTQDLIFSVPVILSYISHFMTLQAGDVVLTGTPDGVGALQVGDRVEVLVEGVGMLSNSIVEAI